MFDFKNLVRIKSGIAMSLQNTNIWNSIKTVDDFDTYGDEFEEVRQKTSVIPF